VFKRTGTNWVQEAYLKPPNPGFNDNFGSAIGISGETIVVGAFNEDSNQTTITNGTSASSNNSALNAGAAYVFKRSGTSWAQEAYLKASNANANAFLGNAVAISGETIAVSAGSEDSNQTTITNGANASSNSLGINSGAVYMFKRSGNSWTQEAYLKAPNADTQDMFGSSVAISGDTIVVGALNEASNQTTISNGTSASSDNSAAYAGAAYVIEK